MPRFFFYPWEPHKRRLSARNGREGFTAKEKPARITLTGLWSYSVWMSSVYSSMSPGWHCNKRQIVSMFIHDTNSPRRSCVNVACPINFSLRIRVELYPAFFNSDKMLNLYLMGILHLLLYMGAALNLAPSPSSLL